jgi:dipeptidyl aminopeptidase/acylaminoacyl peptidase
MTIQKTLHCLFAVTFVACATATSLAVESKATLEAPTASATKAPGYDKPPQYILDVMHAPAPPQPVVSATGEKILLVYVQAYPSIERVATPFLRLAGVRVEPKNHSKHDTPGGYGVTPCATGYQLANAADGAVATVKLPKNACAGRPVWSADGKHFAFVNLAPDAVELWIGEGATGALRQVPSVRLNPMFNGELQWMADQKTLLVKRVPEGMGGPPPEPVTPIGPSIQETGGEKGQSSTYEVRDTLNNTHDEDLFDYYASTQLALVNAETLAVANIGRIGKYQQVSVAPDGQHLLVQAIHKPYSYITTYDHFPREVEVWDVSDRGHVQVKTIASVPLADRVPIGGVRTGPRDFEWRATEPATLVWAEALDGGDWNATVPARDKVMLQKAPFTGAAAEIAQTEERFGGMQWGEKPGTALLYEYDENKHWRKTLLMNVDDLQQKPRVIWDLSSDDAYADPGEPVETRLANGAEVMRQDGDSIYLSGMGASPDGLRPFLDRLDLGTLKYERMFRSDKSSLELFLAFAGKDTVNDAGKDERRFITWHQSPSDPPNAFARTLGKQVSAASGEAAFESTSVAITHIADPTPQVRAIQKRLVKYKRADGLDLSFTLYTPPGYKEGTRVPAILYAYPLDYADPSKAGQVTTSQETFTRLYEYRLLLLAGYAIIDDASFPIIGDPKKAYDTYLEQLVADAKAAVDEAVRLGVVDPQRIGVTGHSHGALMTANLVAHSDLFRAGAATSGSYNKTLTPFGFQNERRSVWEAPEVYRTVSPFFSADKLKTPLLLVHGAEDANPGTTPLQSQKLYEAIRGNGGTARLVILPHEPHWYSAMESNEQLIYEMIRWFDKYVKNAPAK